MLLNKMAGKLEHIVMNLKECFDGTPWYGISVMEKLEAIPWEKSNEKKYGSKSIAVLTQHIINWRIFILRKLKGDVEYDLKIDGPNDWSDIKIKNSEEWEALKTNLRQTQEQILEILSNSTDTLLQKNVPGKNYTFGNVLPSLAQHDIYHLGQIAMLNAMQGS